MITFFTMRSNTRTLRMYFQNWGGALAAQVRIACYEDDVDPAQLLAGTYIFCDTDLMPLEEIARAARLHRVLESRGETVRLLNHPQKTLRRYELLKLLHESGVNSFNGYRLDENLSGLRFPVFVRHERLHKGSLTPVLSNQAELDDALAQLGKLFPREELLIVEFLDVSQDGLFRKYGAVRVGDVLIPHHVLFDRKWHIKLTQFSDDWMLQEERDFQNQNPHRDELMQIFEMANIEYGRIDYAFYKGKLQVWEINTNPTLLYPREDYSQPQMPAKVWFARHLNAAFKAIDDKTPKAWSLGAQF